MMITRISRLLLGSLLVLSAGGLALRTTWWLARAPVLEAAVPVLRHGTAGLAALPPVTAVEGCCGTALLGSAAWLAATTTLALASSVADQVCPRTPLAAVLARLSDRACPRLARTAVAATVGLALGAVAAGPALASSGPVGSGLADDAARVLTGLRLPDRTTGGIAAPVRVGPPRVVVVHPGDCLWSLASRLLPPGASDATTTTAWHRLHRANAARLGADPDLVLPGTRLLVPPLVDLSRKDLP